MKTKLLNIKTIIQIVIGVLILSSMLNSCAKAYTFSDFENFISQIDGQSTNTTAMQQNINAFKGSKTAILNCLASNNISTSNYTYFAMVKGNDNTNYDFYLATNDFTEFLPSGNYGYVKYSPYGFSIRCMYSNNVWTAYTVDSSNSWRTTGARGAFIGLVNSNNYSGANWQRTDYNKKYWWVTGDYNPTTYLEYTTSITENTHNGSLFTYYLQGNLYMNNQIKLGSITPNDSYYYEVYLINNTNNIKIGTIFDNVNDNNIYNEGALYQDSARNLYVNTRYLKYSTQYRLEITSYYGQGGTNLYEDIDWYIFLPNNATISGDYIMSLGSGDFTQQDNANQIIENNNDILDKLFKPDTEKIQETLNTLMENNFINSGDVPDKIILDYIDTSGDDFIITWNNFTPHWTIKDTTIGLTQPLIPEGQINFSKIERDNPILGYIMTLERTLLSIAIMTLLFREYYITLTACIGDNIFVFGKDRESKKIIEKGSNTK